MATVHREAVLRGAPAAAPAPAPRRAPAGAAARAWLGSLGWHPALAAAGLAAVLLALLVVALSSGPGGSGAPVRTIRAEVLAPHASATLRLSGSHAQLDVAGMPQTPANRVYEVWLKRSGAAQPTDALFTVSRTGDATVGVPGSVAGVKVIMVTAEPLGGSRVPTSSPVIVARV